MTHIDHKFKLFLGEQGQRHLQVCSKKESRLTLPYMKYFETFTHDYVWSNKEFQEFPTSFASSKTLHDLNDVNTFAPTFSR